MSGSGFVFLGAASSLALATAAFAQTGTPPQPGTAPTAVADTSARSSAPPSQANAVAEVIVTAQRRDQSLSRTPVSVAVVSSDTLAKAQIATENDLRQATPGLQIRSGGTSNALNYAIRGQSQDPFSNVRPGVLPYFNDVQIGGSAGASAFYDLQSVQVLKGPQGTLFGRSATGGAVLFTSQKPTPGFGGYVSASGGNLNAQKLEGALNVPLLDDKLLVRVSGLERSRSGFQDNIYDGRTLGAQHQYAGRVSVTAKPTSRLTNEFVYDYFHSNSQNTVGVLSGLLPYTGAGAPFIPIQFLYSGTATPVAAITGQCTVQAFVGLGACPPVNPAVAGFYNGYFADPHHPAGGIAGELAAQQARGPYIVNTDSSDRYRTNNSIISNTTTFDLGGGRLIKNIVGGVNIRNYSTQESDGTPYGAASGPAQRFLTNTSQFSDELQTLGKLFNDRLDYVVGFYYSDENSTTYQSSAFFDILFGGLTQVNHYTNYNTTYAGYGQGTYKLNDSGLAVTAGARYTSEEVRISTLADDSVRAALGTPAPPGYAYDQSTTYDRVSWTVGLQDQLSPELLLYANGRRAFKSGGYNGTVQPKIGGADVSGDAYKAEQVTAAEGGAKFSGRLFGMPTRLDGAFYYMWIENSQRVAFSIVNGGPAGLTVNVPNGTTYGFEGDAQVSPTDWLTLGAVVNYTNASFGDDPVSVNGSSQTFDTVPDTPEFTGSLFADVTVPLNDKLSGFAHVDSYYQSASYDTPRSQNYAGTKLPAYGLTNFRVGVQDLAKGWSLTLNIKNAFDRVYYAGGVATGEIYQVNFLIPAEPRTFTVEARVKF